MERTLGTQLNKQTIKWNKSEDGILSTQIKWIKIKKSENKSWSQSAGWVLYLLKYETKNTNWEQNGNVKALDKEKYTGNKPGSGRKNTGILLTIQFSDRN